MVTDNSIEIHDITEKCFAAFETDEGCSCLTKIEEGCGSVKCPFYKPEGFKDWIRIEDRDGINLIPPEECRRDNSGKGAKAKI